MVLIASQGDRDGRRRSAQASILAPKPGLGAEDVQRPLSENLHMITGAWRAILAVT
jgi:hypothetical protein